MPVLHFRLSEAAYQGLIEQARNVGFIRGKSSWGLNLHVTGLLLLNPEPSNWKDARPDYISSSDREMLEAGYFPPWDLGEVRILRGCSVSQDQIDHTVRLARHLGVVRQVGPGVSKEQALKPVTIFSQFWEAVGLGWLVPDITPVAPNFKYRNQQKRYEMNW